MTETTHAGARPTWDDYWAGVGNEDWLAARALCEISPRVRSEVGLFLHWDDNREPHLDWEAFATFVDEDGTMSSGERRLALVVAALTTYDRGVDLRNTLGQMGSWEAEVWRILTEWATGGRCTVVSR